ncbi:MAG: hypothetical protein R2839_07775 [Thermomicrobiales bacterium]
MFAARPSRANPKINAAAGNPIDGYGLLQQKNRVAVGVSGHHQTEPNPAGVGSQRSQCGVPFEAGIHDVEQSEEVIDEVEVVPPGVIDDAGDLDQFLPW